MTCLILGIFSVGLVMPRQIAYYMKQQMWKLKTAAYQTVENRSDVENQEQTQGVFVVTKNAST
jgi:hypothetical protein